MAATAILGNIFIKMMRVFCDIDARSDGIDTNVVNIIITQ
jgi:hypothetical protein